MTILLITILKHLSINGIGYPFFVVEPIKANIMQYCLKCGKERVYSIIPLIPSLVWIFREQPIKMKYQKNGRLNHE